jgi:DNA-binding LytR/AlgR family response regulator
MNVIRCIVVDDEPLARKGMLEYIGHVDFLNVVGVFENAQQVYPVMNELNVQLMFLDIDMPRLSGLDFLRSLQHPPMVIITTAYQDYALDGFELDVVDYLLKPIALPHFLKAVNKAKDNSRIRRADEEPAATENDHFFVKENGRFTRIFYKDVLYAEALQNYVSIHLRDRKLITYITMTILEKQFPASDFMRIHKSYIVSLSRIDSVEGNMINIGSESIPVSRKMKDELMERVVEQKLVKRKE